MSAIDLASAADADVALFSTGNETMITLLCSTPISVSVCSRRNLYAELLGHLMSFLRIRATLYHCELTVKTRYRLRLVRHSSLQIDVSFNQISFCTLCIYDESTRVRSKYEVRRRLKSLQEG